LEKTNKNMARLQLDLPSHFRFSCELPVRITDLNYGGHVGNDTILSYIHEARMLFLRTLDYTEMNFGGVGLIMSDVVISFKAEAFYGDRITIDVSPGEISRAGFELFYYLRNGEKSIAKAKTSMVCFDYGARKVVSIPPEASAKLKS